MVITDDLLPPNKATRPPKAVPISLPLNYREEMSTNPKEVCAAIVLEGDKVHAIQLRKV